ncbi:hypothetical protein [Streptomyces globisporus]|uniref:hypothetical protein n=1 Tax=Streptomyces globisporus TaxID=1908 RepID=UPI0037C792A3
MAVSKIKMSNARRALIEAGMSRTMARGALRLLDLSEPLKPQIVALAEEDPELFGLDADGNPLDDADNSDSEDEDERPMTLAEAKVARLRGTNNPLVFKRPHTERKSTASKTAQEAAAHLRATSKDNPPPVRKYIEPVRDLNNGPAPARQPNSSANALAARLRR